MKYLGDIAENGIVYFSFNTNDSNGASVTYTGGVVEVYKDDATGTETTTGVTVSKDHDDLVGAHIVTIDTSNVFYATGADYNVVLDGATIDSQTVDAFIATFSIENRVATLSNTVHGGVASTLTLKSVVVTNADGHAVALTSTGSNGYGLRAKGHGTGEGVSAVGGDSGHGIEAVGGDTTGVGIRIVAGTGSNRSGIEIRGDGTGEGIDTLGGAQGDGLKAVGQGAGVDIRGDITGTIDVCTTNTDMRGTDGALTFDSAASVAGNPRID